MTDSTNAIAPTAFSAPSDQEPAVLALMGVGDWQPCGSSCIGRRRFFAPVPELRCVANCGHPSQVSDVEGIDADGFLVTMVAFA